MKSKKQTNEKRHRLGHGLKGADNEVLIEGKRYQVDSKPQGLRLTDCCGAWSTFSDSDLVCCKCYHEVKPGEGDGNEYLEKVPLEHCKLFFDDTDVQPHRPPSDEAIEAGRNCDPPVFFTGKYTPGGDPVWEFAFEKKGGNQ